MDMPHITNSSISPMIMRRHFVALLALRLDLKEHQVNMTTGSISINIDRPRTTRSRILIAFTQFAVITCKLAGVKARRGPSRP